MRTRINGFIKASGNVVASIESETVTYYIQMRAYGWSSCYHYEGKKKVECHMNCSHVLQVVNVFTKFEKCA